MNIINNLMAGDEFIDEVKGNMVKFEEYLADFKDLHASYADTLSEEVRQEDNEKWYQPRYAQIAAFVVKATKWIRAIEDPSSPLVAEATSSAAHVENPLPDSADNADPDPDFIDAQSVIGAEAAEATADTSAAIELDERLQHSLHLQDRISLGPAVRPKTGVQESIQIRLRGGLVASQEGEQFGWNTVHSVTSRGIHSGERRHHLTSLTVSDTRKKRTQITTQELIQIRLRGGLVASQKGEQYGRNTAHSVTSRGIHSGERRHHLTSLTVSDHESIQIRLRGGLVASQEGEQFGWNTVHSVTSRGIHSGERRHHLTSLTVSDTRKKRTQITTQELIQIRLLWRSGDEPEGRAIWTEHGAQCDQSWYPFWRTSGKMSHITRRMNIINNLMAGDEFIDEVKGNMVKFEEYLADFKDLHASYADTLSEEVRQEDNEKWYQPRYAQIAAFVVKATKWIRAIEDPSSPLVAEATSSAAHVENPLPDSADNADPDPDFIDAQSDQEKMSHITRRMNIINNLMAGDEFIDEVKGNMVSLRNILPTLRTCMRSYADTLSEEVRQEDNEKWYQPRYAQIAAFVVKATKWIRAIEDPSSPLVAEATSSAAHVENPLPDSADNADPDPDFIDAQSGSSRGSSEASTTLRINARPNEWPYLPKHLNYRRKHEIEEQEEMLRKRRERWN
ncbi:hypothetical protein GBF38_000166 [Nibea albiflora]|nr:hypothetical protein GBF38_000166 [Nibea albiflora]